MSTNIDLENSFTYHAPVGDQPQRYNMLRAQAKVFAETIDALCPDSAEKTLAIRKLQETIMWANSSIACNGSEPIG